VPALKVHVGTSGYNYPEWKGTFYPDKLPAAKMLAYYVERFSTVEINATFYRMPNAKTVAGWATIAPAGFTYVLKAPQRITHFARLRNVDEPLRYFCDTAQGLGDKLGPLLFQLPPNFKKASDRLAELLSTLPAAFRVAFEFRHPSWFAETSMRFSAGATPRSASSTPRRAPRRTWPRPPGDTCGCAIARTAGAAVALPRIPAPRRPGIHTRSNA